MKNLEIIKATKLARSLISDEKNWTQRAFARNHSGGHVSPKEPEATCFCAMGAIQSLSSFHPKILDDAQYELFLTAQDEMNGTSVASINDYSNHETVLTMFDLTIKRLEETSLLS